jgi:SAM-dependent methyltransferase
VPDEWYDYVLFTQVIEHLPEPANVLEELRRLLTPGGKILITGPLFYEEHEQPYDFYRYTQFGFRHLIEKAGLSIERLEWLEGYYGTLGYQLNRMAYYLPWKQRDFSRKPDRYLLLLPMLILKLFSLSASIVFHRLELRDKYVAAGYPKNYAILAVKSTSH